MRRLDRQDFRILLLSLFLVAGSLWWCWPDVRIIGIAAAVIAGVWIGAGLFTLHVTEPKLRKRIDELESDRIRPTGPRAPLYPPHVVIDHPLTTRVELPVS